MANLVNPSPIRALDTNGDPVDGAELRFFTLGTTTPEIVYTDVNLTTPHPTPILSDASGIFPTIYFSGIRALRAEVTTGGVALPGYPIERVGQISASQSSASQISKNPVEGNPSTNVEDAINSNSARLNALGNPSVVVQEFLASETQSDMRESIGISPGAVDDIRAIDDWAAGDVIYHDGTNIIRLAIGTSGQILTVASDGISLEYASAFGTGQTRQDVSASRAANTIYVNETGRPIEVTIQGSSAAVVASSEDGTTFITVGTLGAPGSFDVSCTFIVQAGDSYRCAGNFTLWTEFR